MLRDQEKEANFVLMYVKKINVTEIYTSFQYSLNSQAHFIQVCLFA